MDISRQRFATSRLLACGVVLALDLSLCTGRAAAGDDLQLRAEAPVGLQSPVRGGPLAPRIGSDLGTIFLDLPKSHVAEMSRPFAGWESRTLRSQRVPARRRPSVLPVLAGVAAGYATAAIVAHHSDSAETVVAAGAAAGVSVGVLVGVLLR